MPCYVHRVVQVKVPFRVQHSLGAGKGRRHESQGQTGSDVLLLNTLLIAKLGIGEEFLPWVRQAHHRRFMASLCTCEA